MNTSLKAICKAKKINWVGSDAKPVKKQSLFEELGVKTL
jgi:ribonuclease HI